MNTQKNIFSRRSVLRGMVGLGSCMVLPTLVEAAFSPTVRVLFVANTYGLTDPCPGCGRQALGGLARRAGILNALRADGIPTLYVAGPYELAPHAEYMARLNRNGMPTPVPAERLCAAHALCKPDIACLSSVEMAYVGQKPKGFDVLDKKPLIRRISIGGMLCVFILFPELKADAASVPASMLKSVVKAGQASAEADLVIGVSGWGFDIERRALPMLDGVFDILLGAGKGAPFPMDIPSFAPSVVWCRSDSEGRNLIEITCSAGVSKRPRLWIRDVDVVSREIPLGASVRPDPSVYDVLARERTL